MVLFVTFESRGTVETVRLPWTLAFKPQGVITELKGRKAINWRIVL